MLNQKTQRHVERVVITPPTTGPLYVLLARCYGTSLKTTVYLQYGRHNGHTADQAAHHGNVLRRSNLGQDNHSHGIQTGTADTLQSTEGYQLLDSLGAATAY